MGSRYQSKNNLVVRADFRDGFVYFKFVDPKTGAMIGEELKLNKVVFHSIFSPAP